MHALIQNKVNMIPSLLSSTFDMFHRDLACTRQGALACLPPHSPLQPWNTKYCVPLDFDFLRSCLFWL